mmetsp:Transcript_80941/g.241215  ORF Transcript_80941/g.241215 Transcript_80941/m.241215 type:complete len:337 (-) Transcript_80941:120-1130(-)
MPAPAARPPRAAAAAGEEAADPPRKQVVFFVRHAESRWNRAQAEYGLVSMLWENDHGLSEWGRGQAEALRSRLRATLAKAGDGVRELPAGAPEELWLAALLRPDVVYSSPFTRALQTAVIGLKDVFPRGTDLVVMREAREQKNFGGADSTGVATGAEIPVRLEEEMRGLYEASCTDKQTEAALQALREVRLDTSGVCDEWWGPLAGDAEGALLDRIQAFVERLRWTRGVAAGGGGGAAVVVGHSLFFRTVFSTFITRKDAIPLIGVASSLTTRVVPYCAVVGARFEWDDAGRPRIVEAMPLLGTELLPADVDARGSHLSQVSGCVCGRGKAECTIA